MERFVMMSQISDGKLYGANDMVRAHTGGCQNCHYCCTAMCDTIVLDPYDIYSLTKGLNTTFADLINDNKLELGLHDLVTLPHIKDTGKGCNFLNESNRCGIYDYRPNICRLFPLGRYYYDNTFSYFLQTHECKVENRSKVKVKQWLGIPDLPKHEAFVTTWHYLVKNITEFMKESKDHETKKMVHVKLLNTFYERPYNFEQDFFEQFEARVTEWRSNRLDYDLDELMRESEPSPNSPN